MHPLGLGVDRLVVHELVQPVVGADELRGLVEQGAQVPLRQAPELGIGEIGSGKEVGRRNHAEASSWSIPLRD